MKNTFIKTFLISSLTASFLYYFYTPTTHLHIYHDPATIPAFLQMKDYIKTNPKDTKIILWDRYNHSIQNKEKYQNTLFIQDTNNYRYTPLSPRTIRILTSAYLYKNPKANIHFHFNYMHSHVIDELKRNKKIIRKLKSVHFYEDAPAFFLRETKYNFYFTQKTPYDKFLYIWAGTNSKSLCDQNPLEQCNHLEKIQHHTQIIYTDLQNYSKNLSIEDQSKIFKLINFDKPKYESILKNKPNLIYILGFDGGHLWQAQQLAALKKTCDQLKEKHPNASLFYKQHPYKLNQPTHAALNHLCPTIQPIETQIPFETFLTTNLKPTFVAGFSSSLFFNLKENDILYYIPRKINGYLNILTKAGILKNNQIITPEQQIQELQESGIYEFLFDTTTPPTRANQSALWLLEIENKMCNIFFEQCFNILEKNEKTIRINLNKGTTFHHFRDYQWIIEKKAP